ncbi:MAG: hypothetical protein MUE85_20535 [Microscillaceae bacterium]|nr:hypothetical protein [Microscillaceae bacterium]
MIIKDLHSVKLRTKRVYFKFATDGVLLYFFLFSEGLGEVEAIKKT